MNEMLFHTHSFIRWLVVLSTLAAIVWMARGLLQKRTYDQLDRRVMTIFSSLVGAQWVVGLILFVSQGIFNLRERWEHLVTMTLVLAVAHVHMMLKKRDDRTRYLGGLISVVVALLLVFAGVAVLGGSRWDFSFTS
jgi:cytochrome bd-type quinol oxidase subunit 2